MWACLSIDHSYRSCPSTENQVKALHDFESSNVASNRHSVIIEEAKRKTQHSLSNNETILSVAFHVAIVNLHVLIAELNGEAICPRF